MEHTTAMKIVAIGTAFAFRGALFVDCAREGMAAIGAVHHTGRNRSAKEVNLRSL
jgi:hypothetical protein